MSYSHDVKNKLAASSFSDSYEKECELYAYIHCLGSLQLRGRGQFFLMFETETSFLTRRIFSMLTDLFDEQAEISARRSGIRKDRYSYSVTVTSTEKTVEILDHFSLLDFSEGFGINRGIKRDFFREESEETGENVKGYLRGVFLSAGYLGAPKNRNYNLEFVFRSKSYAESFKDFALWAISTPLSLTERNGYRVAYTKNFTTIMTYMAVIGAYSVVTDMQNTRIARQLRSDVVRKINCDMANISRTIESAQRQIQAINRINERYTLKYLDPKLEQLALLRLEHREASLKELGQMFSPPKSRSTIDNWFRKIEEIADRI